MKEETSTIRGTVIPQQISGTVDSLRAQIAPLVQATGTTEIMVQDLVVDPEHRSRSRALVAEALAGIETSEERLQ